MTDNAYRMDLLPDEPRRVLEATRFFADQLVQILERGIGHSEVAASWRQFSQHLQESGFWGEPLPREALTERPTVIGDQGSEDA